MPALPYKIPTGVKHMHVGPEKCPQICAKRLKNVSRKLTIDEVKCINKLATICLQKLDEVKSRNKYV